MRLHIVLLLSLLPFFSWAQSAEPQKDTVYNFLFLDARWQNQFAFWGRNYGLELPFVSTNLTYYTHSNFWISAAGYSFFDENIPFQTGLSLGYSRALTEKSDWHISYSQFFIPDDTVPASARTMGYIQTMFGLDWKILYSTIQIHALLNKNSDVFFTTYHSRYFQFNRPLWKKIKVSFEPKASFTFGTNHFDYANGTVLVPGGGSVNTQNDSTSNQGDGIKILNWDFQFPLKFEVGRFTIDTSWKYSAPLNTSETDPSKALHQFMVGLNYFIPFQRVKG
ncbi:MAG TPA: hypothetical protein VFU05_06280 [Cyclobacteriaceae bacterium]|nr:hypothetical protein [Cyclobacteriaceae bacterium]